jgi:hypothetical protein
MKRLIRKILREEIDKSDKHYRILDIISDHVHLPYFKSMEGLTIYDKYDQLYIMKKILGDDIYIREGVDRIYDEYGNQIYIEDSDGRWGKWEYNENSDNIYWENYLGKWEKNEYDDKGNRIYYEEDTGYWFKYEYYDNGKIKYYETSDGIINDYR